MKTKILEIYDSHAHKIQTVGFQKPNDTLGWIAVHFERDKYMPFALHESLAKMKTSLLDQGFTWEWKNTNWLF